VSRPATATAGVPIVSPVLLRTHLNLDLASDYPIEDETFRFRIAAEGLIPGTEFTTEIGGSVTLDLNAEAHESLTAAITVPYAGNWTVKITEGLLNPQHLLGSPFVVSVGAAQTDPAACTVEFPDDIVAGSVFSLSVSTMDSFLNPTAHGDDSFYGVINGIKQQLVPSDGKFVYINSAYSAAADYALFVYHDATGSQIANSPLRFTVTPAAPNAARSTHTKPPEAIDSGSSSSLTLQAFPSDQFDNAIPVAAGYTLSVVGLDNDGDGTFDLTFENAYSVTLAIPRGIKATVVVTFALGGTIIGDGDAVKIRISPPRNWNLILGGVALFCIIGVLLKVLLDKFGRDEIKRDEEAQISAEGKLKEVIAGKVWSQNVFSGLETFDVTTDVANGALKAAAGPGSLHAVLFYGFILLAVVSAPLGVYQILLRSKVKSGYRAMMAGTPEEVERYAKALDENDEERTEEKLKTKRKFIVLDMTVMELGIHGLVWEDVPSLLLNFIVLMLDMRAGEKATMSTYASFVSFGFSCVMAGRKMGLPSLKKEQLVKKRDLEKVMRKNGWLDEFGGKENKDIDKQPSVGGLFKDLKTVRLSQYGKENQQTSAGEVLEEVRAIKPSQVAPLVAGVSGGKIAAKAGGVVRAAADTGGADAEAGRLKRELASAREREAAAQKELEKKARELEKLMEENLGLRSRRTSD
jgi:hypothetical protein